MIKTLEKIAENKYFIGVVMIMMNIGARFMIEELTPKQKEAKRERGRAAAGFSKGGMVRTGHTDMRKGGLFR